MKGLKFSKKIKEESNAFIELINNYCNKLNKEYRMRTKEALNQLLVEVALGEGLNPIELKEKYLETSNKVDEKKSSVNINTTESETLLDTTIINDETFYYENKDRGNIFNSKGDKVGVYENKQFSISK